MMSKHMRAVMQRRRALLAKIAAQRGQLIDANERLQPAWLLADRAVAAGRFLRAHPVLVAGFAGWAGLLVMRGRGLSGLLKGSWRVWRAYRYVNDFSKKLTPRP